MNKNKIPHALCIGSLASALLLTGCTGNDIIAEHTRSLLTTHDTKYEHVWVTLIEDQVIAFGTLSHAVEDIPQGNLIIAGKQYNYVIETGSALLTDMIQHLNPEYLRLEPNLGFNSPHPRSHHFYGKFEFSYTKDAAQYNATEKAFFEKYNIQPCQCVQDKTDLYRFDLRGKIYPKTEPLQATQSLSKPYHITIQHLDYQKKNIKLTKSEILENMTLLPLTITFDVIELPAKILGIYYQP